MNRRTAATALCATAVLAGLAGCGSDSPTASKPAAPLPALALATAPAATAPSPAATSAAPSAAPTSARPTPPPTRAGDTTVAFYGAKLVLPAGWKSSGVSGGGVCFDPLSAEDCAVQVLNPVAEQVASQGGSEEPDPDNDYGWYLGTDVPGCVDADHDYEDTSAVLTSRIVTKGFTPLGTKTAVYRVFGLSCQGKKLGQARLWGLPSSKLFVIQGARGNAQDADVDRLVSQIDATRYAAG